MSFCTFADFSYLPEVWACVGKKEQVPKKSTATRKDSVAMKHLTDELCMHRHRWRPVG